MANPQKVPPATITEANLEPGLELVPECAFNPGVKTRLSCAECGQPICPKCMVSCPVGQKCKPCVNKTAAHSLTVTKRHYITGGVLGLVAALVFSVAVEYLYVGYLTLDILLAFFIGIGAGKGIHKTVQYKVSRKLLQWTIGACILGLAPLGLYVAFSHLFDGGYGMLLLIKSGVFVFGVRRGFTSRFWDFRE